MKKSLSSTILLVCLFIQKPLIGECGSIAKESSNSWKLLYNEDFESSLQIQTKWVPEDYSEIGRFTDNGDYFKKKHKDFKLPKAHRVSTSFGKKTG